MSRTEKWVDITAAVLLPLATIASAWCAYQASVWSGLQTFRLSAANEQNRLAAEQKVLAATHQNFDASILVQYLEARVDGDDRKAGLLLDRLRPVAKAATKAWLKQDPLKRKTASRSPFSLPVYDPPEQQQARRHHRQADQLRDEAQQANETSDKYVFTTVLFASVLFFGGLVSKIETRLMRLTMVITGSALFLICAGLLLSFPVAAG